MGSTRRRRAAILVVAAVAVVLLASSCMDRVALESYLEKLDAIRAQSDQQSQTLEQELQGLKNGPGAASVLSARLESARRMVLECNKKIKTLGAPQAAQKLNKLVLELNGEAAAFFAELHGMLDYSGKREPLVAGIQTVSSELDSTIASNPAPAAVAAALAASSAKVDGIAAQLGKLKPPSFLEGIHMALLDMLKRYSTSLNDLKAAVERSDASGINTAQNEIKQALSGNLSEETKKGIEAYNSRIKKIDRLREQANQEESRITTER